MARMTPLAHPRLALAGQALGQEYLQRRLVRSGGSLPKGVLSLLAFPMAKIAVYHKWLVKKDVFKYTTIIYMKDSGADNPPPAD